MTIKGKLMELVMWAYKKGHEDGVKKCDADVLFLEKKVDEAIRG